MTYNTIISHQLRTHKENDEVHLQTTPLKGKNIRVGDVATGGVSRFLRGDNGDHRMTWPQDATSSEIKDCRKKMHC